MAQFREYNAPDRELRPSEAGFSAFETAGRRIGPAYSQAAQDVREGGRITAQLLELRKWPFDMLALEQRDQSGGGVRLGGGGRGGGGLRGHNQLSAGAGALGRLYGGGGGGGGGIDYGGAWGGGGTYNTDPLSGLPQTPDLGPIIGGQQIAWPKGGAGYTDVGVPSTQALNETYAQQWASDLGVSFGGREGGAQAYAASEAVRSGAAGVYGGGSDVGSVIQNLDTQVNGSSDSSAIDYTGGVAQ